MPQPIEMGPQNDLSSVLTQQAVAVRFEMHEHPPLDEEPGIGTVYFPINNGVYLSMPIMCADCFAEFLIVDREIVECR